MSTLYIVSTPIGNLSDMTPRAIEVLKSVDIIAAEDTRHTRKLLTHFDIHTRLTSFFEGNEEKKITGLIEEMKHGLKVALVSDAGTPAISDPGFKLVRTSVEAGIQVVSIPGASAVISALAVSGLPTDQFTFVGFLPDKPGKRKTKLEGLKDIEHTIVFYVSKWKIEKVLSDMLEVFGDREAVLCRELTKIHEEITRGKISKLLEHAKSELKGEITLVVGSRELGAGSKL